VRIETTGVNKISVTCFGLIGNTRVRKEEEDQRIERIREDQNARLERDLLVIRFLQLIVRRRELATKTPQLIKTRPVHSQVATIFPLVGGRSGANAVIVLGK